MFVPQTMLLADRVPHTMFMPFVTSTRPVPHTMLLLQTMLVPHTMLSASASNVPHTMLSASLSNSVPQTMLSDSEMVPHTMFWAHAGSFTKIDVPHTMLVPHTMFCAHDSNCPSMVVALITPDVSHHAPFAAAVSIERATSTAPATLSAPAPWRSASQSTPAAACMRSAVYCSTAFIAFGVSDGRAG